MQNQQIWYITVFYFECFTASAIFKQLQVVKFNIASYERFMSPITMAESTIMIMILIMTIIMKSLV